MNARYSDKLPKVPKKDVATRQAVAYAGPMPGKPFHSKLAPHEALIRDLRRQGRTYREIAEILKKDHGLEVHPDTVNSFVIVRAKGAKVYALPDPNAPAIPPAAKSNKAAAGTAQASTEPATGGSGFFETPPPEEPGEPKKRRYNLGY